MTPKQVERLRQVEAAAGQFAQLENLHRQEFSEPVREVVASAKLPKYSRLVATAEKQTLRGVSPFQREVRKAKRAEARQLAERWAMDLMTIAEAERRSRQAVLDQEWSDLHSNDPQAVERALTAAHRASGRPVRVVGVEDGEALLIVRVDGPGAVPESKPATTPSGSPTLHKVTKTDRAAWHRQIVASHVLLAAKEAMAAGPGLVAVRVLAVDHAGIPLLGVRVTRAGLAAANWSDHAWGILDRIDGDIRCDLRGRTQELVTVDLTTDIRYGSMVGA